MITMKSILLIVIVSMLLILITTSLGNIVSRKSNIYFFDAFFGFSILMMVFFIVTHIAVELNVDSSTYHKWIGVSFVFLSIISLFGIKKIKPHWPSLVFIAIYLLFAIYMSSRYTLGEQMGDNIYLFFVVNKNIDIPLLNAFDLNTGQASVAFDAGITKSYISFYTIFSSLYYYLLPIMNKIGIPYLPPYVLNMWVANLIFYYFSAGLILDVIRKLEIKSKYLIAIIILWIGMYTGSIYYNVTLPHIVVTYLVLFLGNLILILHDYFEDYEHLDLLKIFLVLYAMAGFGATGALFIMVMSFAIVANSFMSHKRETFIQIPLFLIPIVQYILIMFPNPQAVKFSVVGYFVVLIACLIILSRKKFQYILFKYSKNMVFLLWILILIISILRIDDYWNKVSSFFIPQYGADRTQDYFSFSDYGMALRNVFYYALITSMFIYQKTKKLGMLVLLIVLFFVNPLMKPWVAEVIARYDVYNRIFFTVFNNTSIAFGLYAAYQLFNEKFRKTKFIVLTVVFSLMIIPTVHQIESYFYPTYKPQVEDFNPLFKLGDSQIEILESVRQKVRIEKLEQPVLISQIFGTAMYAPEFVTLGYNVNQQRNGPIIIGEELYQIFYTPAIPGDFRPEVNVDLRNTCQLLLDKNVDFVIIDKSFSVYDEKVGDYLPIDWYVGRCGAEFVFENDDYIAFRFYRW